MILLIGSEAAHRRMNFREGGDIDLVMEMPTLLDFVEKWGLEAHPFSKTIFLGRWCGCITEMEVAWPGSSAEQLLDRVEGEVIEWMGQRLFLPTLDWLYTIKMSHRYLKNSAHFLKTMRDIHAMRAAGAKIADDAWLALREKETYTRPRPFLNVTKEQFFAEGAKKFPYDHDSVHWAVKTLEAHPAYLYYKAKDKEVWCDKELWTACSDHIKLAGVIEECYVLAIERCLVPFEGKVAPEVAFKMALEKVCTSITSGWFREYAWENYDRAIKNMNPRFWDIFQQRVAEGNVKLNQAA